MSYASSQDTSSVLSVNITFTTNEWRPGPLLSLGQFTVIQQIFEQRSHRGLLGEKYLTLFYWSISYSVEVATVTVIAVSLSLFTLRVCCSLSPSLFLICVMLPYCSFSLRTDFEGKSQSARCWFLRSWLNRGSGTTCWFGECVCVNLWVYIYIYLWLCICLAQTPLTVFVQQQKTATAN